MHADKANLSIIFLTIDYPSIVLKNISMNIAKYKKHVL